MTNIYDSQDAQTFLTLSYSTFHQTFDPADLPGHLALLIQNIYPFLRSFDTLLLAFCEHSNGAHSLQSAHLAFDFRQLLFWCWDRSELHRGMTYECWKAFSNHIWAWMAPLVEKGSFFSSSKTH